MIDWNVKKFKTLIFILYCILVLFIILIFSLTVLENMPNEIAAIILKITILCYLVYQIRSKKITFNNNSLHKSMPYLLWLKYISFSLIIKIYFIVLATTLITFFVFMFPSINNLLINLIEQQNIEVVRPSNGNIILMIISTALLAPLWEELFFRGIILRKLMMRFSLIPAIIISSLIFSIVHSGFNVINAFVMGCFFAYIYLLKQNIWIPIICHSATNFIAILWKAFSPPIEVNNINLPSSTELLGQVIISGLISLVFTILLVIIFMKGWNNLEVMFLKENVKNDKSIRS